MKCKIFDNIDDAVKAKYVREEVFMKEQGFQNEFDDQDYDAIHFEIYEDDHIAGCARLYETDSIYHIGRVAVLPEYRSHHVGSFILQSVEEYVKKIKGQQVCLDAQVSKKGFYLKNGYKEVGEEFYDEHCPHIHMVKELF